MVRYSLEDIERIFGVTYTPDQRAALGDIPFSADVLKECEGTHMLFPGFPLSLLEIREKFADLFYETDDWYVDRAFARNIQVTPTWHLLRMEPVPKSLNMNWGEGQELLLPNEDVPSTAVVAFATMLHFGATTQRLFEYRYVRTSDLGSVGNRVHVGNFHSKFYVYESSNGWRSPTVGLSSVRKMP